MMRFPLALLMAIGVVSAAHGQQVLNPYSLKAGGPGGITMLDTQGTLNPQTVNGRTLQARAQDRVNILDYGAKCDGRLLPAMSGTTQLNQLWHGTAFSTTLAPYPGWTGMPLFYYSGSDDTAAISTALAAAMAQNKPLYIPGSYPGAGGATGYCLMRSGNPFGEDGTHGPALTKPVTIEGDGKDVSRLVQMADNGLGSVSTVASPGKGYAVGDIVSLQQTASFVGSISSATLTVKSVSLGYLAIGQTISGPGVIPGTTIINGPVVVSGLNTWTLSQSQSVTTPVSMSGTQLPTFKLEVVAVNGSGGATDVISLGDPLGQMQAGTGLAPINTCPAASVGGSPACSSSGAGLAVNVVTGGVGFASPEQSTFAARINGVTFRNFSVIATGQQNYGQSASCGDPFSLWSVNDLVADGIGIDYSRCLSFTSRQSQNTVITRSRIRWSARDMINVSSSRTVVSNNTLEHGGDDGIATPDQPAESGAEPVREGVVITGNYITDSAGIDVRGGVSVSITGNTLVRVKDSGITVASGGGTNEGATPMHSVVITGNSITDIHSVLNDPIFGGAINRCIIIGSEAPIAGVIAGVPGMGVPGTASTAVPGAIVSPYEVNLGGAMGWPMLVNGTYTPAVASTAPTAPGIGMVIANNTCVRSLPLDATEWFSALGFGETYGAAGWLDFLLDPDAAFGTMCFDSENGTLVGVRYVDNVCSGAKWGFSVDSGTHVYDMTVADNIWRDLRYFGITMGAAPAGQRIVFRGNDWDLDPYFASPNRVVTGVSTGAVFKATLGTPQYVVVGSQTITKVNMAATTPSQGTIQPGEQVLIAGEPPLTVQPYCATTGCGTGLSGQYMLQQPSGETVAPITTVPALAQWAPWAGFTGSIAAVSGSTTLGTLTVTNSSVVGQIVPGETVIGASVPNGALVLASPTCVTTNATCTYNVSASPASTIANEAMTAGPAIYTGAWQSGAPNAPNLFSTIPTQGIEFRGNRLSNAPYIGAIPATDRQVGNILVGSVNQDGLQAGVGGGVYFAGTYPLIAQGWEQIFQDSDPRSATYGQVTAPTNGGPLALDPYVQAPLTGAVGTVNLAQSGAYQGTGPSCTLSAPPPGTGNVQATCGVTDYGAILSSPFSTTSTVGYVLTGGTGYTVGNFLGVHTGLCTNDPQVVVASIGANGAIATVTPAASGDCSSIPTSGTTPIALVSLQGSGSGATMLPWWTVKAVGVISGGAGYVGPPTVTFSASGAGGITTTGTTGLAANVSLGAGGLGEAVLMNGVQAMPPTAIPLSGAAAAIPANTSFVTFTQSAGVSAQTVNLPAGIEDGQLLQIDNYGAAVTALTFTPAVAGWTNASALAANTNLRLRWSHATTSWHREQ